MSSDNSLSPPLIELLEEHRDWLNQRFRFHASQGKRIEPSAWLDHVRHRLAPILQAAHRALPERAKITLFELYEVSLELFKSGHFGQERLNTELGRLWDELLPQWGRCVARDPRRIVGSFSNACLHLTQVAPQVVPNWFQAISAVGTRAETPSQLLELGKVAAWTSGMAQYRRSALTLAKQLPIDWVRTLLHVPPDISDSNALRYLQGLEEDPWCSLVSHQQPIIENVAICGAFRGFGGPFMAPPAVYCSEGSLLVTDRQHVWQLHADRFGASFQRVDREASSLRSSRARIGPTIDAAGNIEWISPPLRRADLANATSFAFDGVTLAVTIPSSFHVYLFAKPSIRETA